MASYLPGHHCVPLWWLIPAWLAAGLAGVAGTAGRTRGEEPAGLEFFEKKIRPVLVRHCYECHSASAKELKGRLRLDSRQGLIQGGESGPALVPGNAAASLLIAAMRHQSPKMPPKEKLPDPVIADFIRWIDDGAADPRRRPPDAKTAAEEAWREQLEQRRQWWSLQPLRQPPVPEVKNRAWSRLPIDRFIVSRLEKCGLSPAPRAGRVDLIRRLSFALTGLPPSSEEVSRFAADDSSGAWERLVDRTLASPHFGERWARHWMDVVRYSDTYGYEWDIPAKGAWRYRDYLIRAFNAGVPFDRLAREHIAGDLLEEPRIDPEERINESLIGPMFFQMGEKRHGDSAEFDGIHQEMLDNKIDAFSKAFLALTVACARCHDHKLDAVSQRDYYALAGVFMSSRWVTNTLDRPDRNAEGLRQLREIKSRLRPLLADMWLEEVQRLTRSMLEGSRSAEPAGPAAAATGSAWRRLFEERDKKEPPLEDPLGPWTRLVRSSRDGRGAAAAWSEIQAAYATEGKRRAEHNAARFRIAADFHNDAPDGWSADGAGLREATPCGDFTVALKGDAAVGGLLPGGLFTSALSPRLNGAVRSPYLRQFDKSYISFECCGGDFAAHRTIVDNAFLTERQHYLARGSPAWVRLSTLSKNRHVAIEFATKTSNPNFPPRVGLGGACSEEQAADPSSWFGLVRAVVHDDPSTPLDELARFSRLLEGTAPATLEEAAERHTLWFQSALQAWADGKAGEDEVRLINWLLESGLLSNHGGAGGPSSIAGLVARYREVEGRLAVPCTVNGMADLDPGFDVPLNIRGDYDQLGDPVPRGFLEALGSPVKGVASSSSGRRELAESVASSRNPLTARVFVNRVWHWMFGTGIVATPSDFGRLGDPPSHPELLDYLAARFISEGWSVKKLVRAIALTETWRQSGQTTEEADAADPGNRWLHHYPLRRLEAEAIRDAMLAVSGRLEPRLYGPPVDPPRPKEDPQKRLFSGPLDGNGRRSIYTKMTIMEPPRFLETFNQPKPKIPTGGRDVTNSPAQSLALLNDPFVAGQAEHWAKRLVGRGRETPAERLIHMFHSSFGRPPAREELDRWEKAAADFAGLQNVPREEMMESVPVWKNLAHAMYNSKEFIFIR